VEVTNEDAAPPTPSAGDGGGDARAEPVRATMRLAHLAEGVGAIDFCYQGARSGAAVGPVRKSSIQQDAGNAGDAGDLGFAFRDVSRYFTIESSGPLAISIVPAGAASCSNAAALATANVTLDPGKRATVVFFAESRDGGAARPLASFVDDANTVGGRARVRIIHGADGFGTFAARAATSATTLLAERVEPRRASTSSAIVPVDTLGYATVDPITASAALAIDFLDAGASPWQSTPRDLGLGGGSLHTAFVVEDGSGSVDVVWCADEQNAFDLTSCIRLP
jgi:hypothetical protein